MTFKKEHEQILRSHNQEMDQMVFSEDMIERLMTNTATFREMNDASKVVEKYVKRLSIPMSRMETYTLFLSRMEFNQILADVIYPIFNEYILLKEIMIEKGIVTQAEIDQELQTKRDKFMKQNIQVSAPVKDV